MAQQLVPRCRAAMAWKTTTTVQQRTLCSAHGHDTLRPASVSPAQADQQLQQCTISYRGRQVSVPKGAKLRTALLQSGLTPHSEGAVYINCRGIGSCGTCAVEVSGHVDPAAWTTAERLRLNFPPHSAPRNQSLRLACQVVVQGDLQLIKYDRFWGEGTTPLPDLPPQEGPASAGAGVTPLGPLEFVLDPNAHAAANKASASGSGSSNSNRQ